MKGLDWIEKIYFTPDDMLVLGFHGVRAVDWWCYMIPRTWTVLQANLIIYSAVQNRRLLDVACGGGHRSYAVSSLEEVTLTGLATYKGLGILIPKSLCITTLDLCSEKCSCDVHKTS